MSWTISGLKLTRLRELKEFPLDDADALSGLLFDKAPIPLEGGCPGAAPDYLKKNVLHFYLFVPLDVSTSH